MSHEGLPCMQQLLSKNRAVLCLLFAQARRSLLLLLLQLPVSYVCRYMADTLSVLSQLLVLLLPSLLLAYSCSRCCGTFSYHALPATACVTHAQHSMQ